MHPLMYKVLLNKRVLLFAGGVAVTAGQKLWESETVKNAASDALAGAVSMKEEAENIFFEMTGDVKSAGNDSQKTRINVE